MGYGGSNPSLRTMTPIQFIVFIALLAAPTLYQRTKFALNRKAFYRIELREKSGLQIHHGHWGLVFIFVTSFLFIFCQHSFLLTSVAGLGWGLLLDEIVPNLKMPSKDRTLELEVYSRSLPATMIVIIATILVSVLMYVTFIR